MRHPSRVSRAAAVTAFAAVALGVTGVAPAGVAHHASAVKVTVTLTDSRLRVSPTGLQAGAATFVVVNRGKRLHFMAIAGPGLNKARTPKLAPGRSARLTVTLKKGSYMLTLSNPIGLGMSSTHWLQVIPATVVSANASSSVVQATPGNTDPICGGLMP